VQYTRKPRNLLLLLSLCAGCIEKNVAFHAFVQNTQKKHFIVKNILQACFFPKAENNNNNFLQWMGNNRIRSWKIN